jgi:hypothetical protein
MPYHFRKGTDTVYKGNKQVGTTGHSKEAHKKYMAALNIHSGDKKTKKEEIEGALGDVFAVQLPYSGCQAGQLVKQFNPLSGLTGSQMVPDQIHSVFSDKDRAMAMANELYEAHCQKEAALEEKKVKVTDKLKRAMSELEKKRGDEMGMIKENPKEAGKHKEKVAHLTQKIDDLMNKLEKIELSKKEMKADAKKDAKKSDKKEK